MCVCVCVWGGGGGGGGGGGVRELALLPTNGLGSVEVWDHASVKLNTTRLS